MKGILFKPEMIKAIIEDRKTQTRRVIKLPKTSGQPIVKCEDCGDWAWQNNQGFWHHLSNLKPRYQIGEVVYVKEGCTVYEALYGDWCVIYDDDTERTIYPPEVFILKHLIDSTQEYTARTMPAWAARYFIKIKDAKAERLQEITWQEMIAEGAPYIPNHIIGFRELWNSINKPPYDWQSNPWVWVYEFNKVKHGEEKYENGTKENCKNPKWG